MRLQLPPGITAAGFDKALAAFAGVVGHEWVLSSDEDRDTYLDIYAPGDESRHAPAAAIAPASVEEVQAIVRLANEHRIPLWPISRGKNYGYGGSAPRLTGTVVLDLGRMKRILEVDAELGYCVLEPGVGFFDLYQYLSERKIPLWLSIPGNAWGSVLGNALERGFAATPYGDHTSFIGGMEVVLPSGELVRTGMGAMRSTPNWPLFKHGFGPCWDQMFAPVELRDRDAHRDVAHAGAGGDHDTQHASARAAGSGLADRCADAAADRPGGGPQYRHHELHGLGDSELTASGVVPR